MVLRGVVSGRVPGIHAFAAVDKNDVDGRNKPGSARSVAGGHDCTRYPLRALQFVGRVGQGVTCHLGGS